MKIVLVFVCVGLAAIPAYSQKSQNEDVLPEPFSYSRRALEKWEAPDEVKRALPYYLSGIDKKGRPVMVMEASKWDIRSILYNYPDGETIFKRAQEQFFYRVAGNSSWSDTTNGFVLIADSGDFDVRQMSRLNLVRAWTRGTQLIESLMDPERSQIILINTNAVMETLLRLVQPFTDRIVQDLDVYTTDKERWIPRLLQDIPKDQLPAWYGGSKTWTPLRSTA